jgi:hypothetical protein
MLETTIFDTPPAIRVTGFAAPLSDADDAQVESAWRRKVGDSGGRLFNGRIAVVRNVLAGAIDVEIDEYRRLIATRTDPDLKARLALRPLAVSGLLSCADGVVFGRRGASNTEAIGQWELAPSGGIDAATLTPGQKVDAVSQLLIELRGELGLPAAAIKSATMFCTVADRNSGVIDLGIELTAPTLSAADIRAAHTQRGSNEYAELCVLALDALASFVDANRPGIVPVSLALLAIRGLS